MNYDEAYKLLKKHCQLQLLDYYDDLDEGQRRELLECVSNIDFSVTECAAADEKKSLGKLSPADALTISDVEKNCEMYKKAGVEAIRAGKVAAVLLAGGQGTRLGHDGPKGTFNIGLKNNLSIFGCQMATLCELHEKLGVYVHLFIMTSNLNDGATRAFFEQNDYFGYEKSKIHFYIQHEAPAISTDGKILLAEKHRPALSPNGNGGWFKSLEEAGYGKILRDEGIEWLNVYGVDNVLQKICDPVFVGATILSGMACSSKVVRKANADEKVGVLCKEDGLPSIVEYYEMPEDYKNERDENGNLKYCFGVILNYLFNVKKLKECDGSLPYHFAKKKVPCIVGGEKFVPEQPNAYKLETLAVDIVKMMGSCLAVEVEREKEFAPVKNASGVDSVETARALLIKNGVII